MKKLVVRSLAVVLFLSGGMGCAAASSISFTGNLRTDATVVSCGGACTLGASDTDGDYAQYAAVLRSFVVSSPSDVQIVSFSYGGGVNGAGTAIAEGGLEPYLSLFDSTGNFLSSTYFGVTCPPGANTNSSSGACYDVLLDAGTLSAGTYQIALTAFENMSFAENYGSGTLADGFTGLGNLNTGEDLHYAFDVNLNSTAPPAVTPEPASGVLASLGAMFLVAFKQKLLSRRKS
jgi:hypothetical protein